MSDIDLTTRVEYLQGAQGESGYVMLSGHGAPAASFGAVGNFYINTDTNETYGPKTVEGWGSASANVQIGLQGAQGPRGLQGPQGLQGPPMDLCHQPDTCNFGTADCNAPLAVSIDQRTSRHLQALFDNFSACNVNIPTIDQCAHPHINDTLASFNAFFTRLLDLLNCSNQGSSCKFSEAVERKINKYISKIIYRAYCGGNGSLDPNSNNYGTSDTASLECIGDHTLLESLAEELKTFIQEEAVLKGIRNASATVKGVINGICSGSFDANSISNSTLGLPSGSSCLTSDQISEIVSIGGDLFSTLQTYSTNLKAVLTGGADCGSIHAFIGEVLGSGFEISGGGCTVKLNNRYFEIEANGCNAYIGLDKIELNCEGNQLLADFSGIVLTLSSGAFISLKPEGVEVDDGQGNFIKAYPSSITIQNDAGTNVVVSPTSIQATSSDGGSAEINSQGHVALSTTGENSIEFNDDNLKIVNNDSEITINSEEVKIDSTHPINIKSDELNIDAGSTKIEVKSADGVSVKKGGTTATIDSDGVSVKKETITTSIGGEGLKYKDTSIDTTITLDHTGLSSSTPVGYVYLTTNPIEDRPTIGMTLIDQQGDKCDVFPQTITMKDGDSGETMVLDVPKKGGNGDRVSAKWREIAVCVDGVAKHAMVLMSEPY